MPSLKNFSPNSYFQNTIEKSLLENDSILTDDKDIEKTMNDFFINITKTSNLKPHKDSSLTDNNKITSNLRNP